MATSLLILAVLVFTFRGFFLGFVGVIGKLCGLVLAYLIAIIYRSQLAEWVIDASAIDLPAWVVEVGCGAALFFLVLFLTSFIITHCAKLLGRILPPLEPILNNQSTAGRIAGALSNGCIGAAIVLLGIWIYGSTTKSVVHPPQLQQVANQVGLAALSMLDDETRFSLPDLTNITSTNSLSSKPVTTPSTNTITGRAVISSDSNPQRQLVLQTTDTIAQPAIDQPGNKLMELLGNEQVRELIKNPQIQQLVSEQLAKNPEQFNQLTEQSGINPQQLNELLQKFQSQMQQ